ncbi:MULTISPECIES: putative nucleotidyltransferase substrate binding domain-containing protein [Halomonas]|uniref:putative nucleotidyltransferase substrate binding domain-containing protein n=1 Tax=Halomonas TaxID=2745 RepID=UPI00186653A0|nr:putative nucleotidyltransferase substrate binding domain-containing protein [Halomonas citrativorans]
MDVELLEIRQFMGQFPPFDGLSDELLDAIAERVEVSYFKTGSDILELNDTVSELCFIRSGAVEVYRRQGELYNRLGEGDIFGHFSLLRNHKVRFPAQAIEDTLIYFIPNDVFQRLCEEDDDFADFVELERPRLETVAEQQKKSNDMMVTRIRKLVTRYPVMVASTTSLQQAAQQINDSQASAAIVITQCTGSPRYSFQDSEGVKWKMVGIFTDSDFRTRVVAEGLSPQTAIGDVASSHLITIQSDASIYEAMLTMLRNNVHHLPVLYRQRPVGVVHLSDIIRYETHSGLYLVSNIFNQSSTQGLAKLAPDVRASFVRMVQEGANSQMVGSALSTVGRSFFRRLLELAEAELGPPPVPYCFMVNGSMARNEQSIVTDQDNALILSDDFIPEEHDAYFYALAKFVSDGLDACGYTYCKGDIMATNQEWRQPLSVWKGYFEDWISNPTPKKLLQSSIFFDLDSIYGEEHFVETLQDLIARRAAESPLFLAAMARNALNRTPPLGFFRTFVMEKDGKHNNSINLKRRGTAPMVDLIRIHALACGSKAQNTFQRLKDISDTQLLAPGVSDKLSYAFEFLCMTRLRHQMIDIQEDREPDNNIEPENVEDSERHTLKDAFHVLSNAQKFLKFRYPVPAQRQRH